MEDVRVRNGGSNLSPKSRMLLGTMAVAVPAGLGATVHAAVYVASENLDDKAYEPPLIERGFLDTFTLSTVEPAEEGLPGTGIPVLGGARMGPATRIPSRLALRSPVRPPLVCR